jgi:hypothetical protein
MTAKYSGVGIGRSGRTRCMHMIIQGITAVEIGKGTIMILTIVLRQKGDIINRLGSSARIQVGD